jgi:iron complex transport system substrate-binding protein
MPYRRPTTAVAPRQRACVPSRRRAGRLARPAGRQLTALLAVLALAAACGGTGTETDTEAAVAQDAAPAEDAVVIGHRHGETEVPADPERVVAVGFNDADVVLALGVPPVGERSLLGGLDASARPWFVDELGDAAPPTELGAEELDVEAVAQLEPDLIVGLYSAMTADEYATLSQIAPTIAQPEEFIDFGVPWREQLEITGRALGREDRAAELTAELEQAFADARDANPAFAGTPLVLASASTPELYVYGPDDVRTRFFLDLGFALPEDVEDETDGTFAVEISRERTDLLDHEVLVTYGDPASLEGDAAWAAMEVVEEARTLYLDETDDVTNALGFNSPLSLPYALDAFVPRLEDAVDDDPATVPEPTS